MDRRAAKKSVPGQLSLFDSRFIRLGERFVEYRFVRRRRRTLGITVDADGLAVAAPLGARLQDIESFLLDKERWILAKLEEWARVPRPRQVRVQTDESLPLHGVPLALQVREGRRAVSLDGRRLLVCAPGPRRAAQALTGWLKTRALERLAPRAGDFAAQLGLAAPRVALSNARGQWGVCVEDGTIRLNWRLVHLDCALADYVVAHEVAHLVEMNHSKRFWAVVSKLYPAWREARERLELAGAGIPVIMEA
jgi:predicted metal-dependent hydrolase